MGALMIQCAVFIAVKFGSIRIFRHAQMSSFSRKKVCSLKFINEYNFNFAVPSHSDGMNECI